MESYENGECWKFFPFLHVQLRKFQTKQSRRSSLNESDAAVLGVNVDLLDNASSATESSTDFLSPETGGDESSQQSVHSEEGTFSQQSSHGSTPVSAKTEITAPNETDNALKTFNNHDQRLPPQPIDKCHSLPKIAGTENVIFNKVLTHSSLKNSLLLALEKWYFFRVGVETKGGTLLVAKSNFWR